MPSTLSRGRKARTAASAATSLGRGPRRPAPPVGTLSRAVHSSRARLPLGPPVLAPHLPRQGLSRSGHDADGSGSHSAPLLPSVSQRHVPARRTEEEPMPEDDRIRRRAHAIWEREGRPDGRQQEHWAQARREIEAEEGAPPPQSAARAPQPSPPPDPLSSEAATIIN